MTTDEAVALAWNVGGDVMLLLGAAMLILTGLAVVAELRR